MASHNALLRDNFPVLADTTAETKRRTLVRLNADGNLIPSGAGEDGFSLVTLGLAGENLTVDLVGETKIRLGGTVAPGAFIASNAAGLGVTAQTGNVIVARALQAGVSGDIITALAGAVGRAA